MGICAAAMWLLTAVLAVWEVASRVERRHRAREERWQGAAVQQVWELLTGDDETPPSVLIALLRRAPLTDLLARMTTATYGLYHSRMQSIVEACDLDRWLLLRARRVRGWRRAYYLKRLSELPHRRACTMAVERYLHDPCREVRFCALLVFLSADAEHLLRRVMAYDAPFTEVETAEVLHLLRCGVFPIAYRPLLESPSENLCRVGLALVAQFDLTEAEPLVRGVVARSEGALARRALYVLSALHGSLAGGEVRACVGAMEAAERRHWLRYLAAEAYTPEQVRRFCTGEERSYYERRVGSYKASLAG